MVRLLEEDCNAAMLMWNQDRVKSALNLKRDQSLKREGSFPTIPQRSPPDPA